MLASVVISFAFVSNSIADLPFATDQSDKVTIDVSKNIVLNARDDDGDASRNMITTFLATEQLG